jgi:DNA-binding NarL/FixJ family response regulator
MLMTEEVMPTDRALAADRDVAELHPLPGVLIVDDDDGMREMLHDMLVRDGRFSVAGEARDGRDAVEAATRLQPAVVILDQQMPGMTGLQALPALRRCAPRAVVVMLSGSAGPDLERQAVAAGAHAFVRKGTRLREVLSLVGTLVEARPGVVA